VRRKVNQNLIFQYVAYVNDATMRNDQAPMLFDSFVRRCMTDVTFHHRWMNDMPYMIASFGDDDIMVKLSPSNVTRKV